MTSQMTFELVLPCYNEAKNLKKIVERAADAAQKHGFNPTDFNLVLVQNGSRDDSQVVMNQLKQDSKLGPWFRIVQIDVNQGYGFGLWQGLLTTTAPYVSWSHADQQCDPEDAFKALQILRSKNSENWIVKGERFGRNWKDRMVSTVFEIIASVVLGKRFREINAQPKVFSRKLLNLAKNPPKDFAFDVYMLYTGFKNGFQVTTIPVEFPPRIHGVSNWSAHFFGRYKTILKMIGYMMRLSKDEGRIR